MVGGWGDQTALKITSVARLPPAGFERFSPAEGRPVWGPLVGSGCSQKSAPGKNRV